MPRHRLPEGERRDTVTFRLPRWMIDWLESKKRPIGRQIEDILSDHIRKESEKK